MKKRKIIASLLAGILLLQHPVCSWCAQESEDEIPILQAETEQEILDTGTSENESEVQGKILDHVYIEQVDLSGLTREEAVQAVDDRMEEITGYSIVLQMDDMSVAVSAKELGVSGQNEDAIRQAMSVGQRGNIIKRYKVKKELEKEALQLDLVYQVDKEQTRNALVQYCVPKNREMTEYTLTREEGEFKIGEGIRGVTLDVDTSVETVAAYLEQVWKDGNGSIELNVSLTEPKGSREELEKVKDVLGQGSTDYSASSQARATNVKNGTSKLNGKLLYPGDEISVCNSMVPFTEENGYEPAASYANGTVVESFGGGICQVSTTLYLAVLRAELEVKERHNHSMIVNYVKPSMDAAIAEGSKDFRFVNNTDAPIYIEGYVYKGSIYFTLYGEETRESGRKVSYESETIETINPTTELTADTQKVYGVVEQTQKAHTGYRAKLWKIVTEDGKQTSKEEVNQSYYQMTPNKYNVGVMTENMEASNAMYAAIAANDLNQVYVALSQYGG